MSHVRASEPPDFDENPYRTVSSTWLGSPLRGGLVALGVGIGVLSCGVESDFSDSDLVPPETWTLGRRAELRGEVQGMGFEPLPKAPDLQADPLLAARVALGRQLFYDPRLSADQTLSCNGCHPLSRYGMDSEAQSTGVDGFRGSRNSPSVYNTSLHVAWFWDGRASTLEQQAVAPLFNPVEMGMSDEAELLERLEAIPAYRAAFAGAFPDDDDPVHIDNLGEAIAAFERGLFTPSPFDAFLDDDLQALSPRQLDGLETFVALGCPTCHGGVAVGGTGFFQLGVMRPYTTSDPGRQAVTGNPYHQGVFKVPSLRNVVGTGPWFHDGSVSTLPEAVRLMARHQLDIELEDAEVSTVLDFFGSLTGAIDADYVAEPELPGMVAAEPDEGAP